MRTFCVAPCRRWSRSANVMAYYVMILLKCCWRWKWKRHWIGIVRISHINKTIWSRRRPCSSWRASKAVPWPWHLRCTSWRNSPCCRRVCAPKYDRHWVTHKRKLLLTTRWGVCGTWRWLWTRRYASIRMCRFWSANARRSIRNASFRCAHMRTASCGAACPFTYPI